MKSDKKRLSLLKQVLELRNFISEAGLNTEKRKRYIRRPEKDFTRERKLGFTNTVILILGLLKKVSTRN